MTIKNMVEMVQQHHPNASETQIIMWLNQAMDGTFSTVSGTKYYGFTKISTIAADDEVISIETVTYDGKHIPFIREPEHMEGF